MFKKILSIAIFALFLKTFSGPHIDITGKLKDANTGDPIEGAVVKANGYTARCVTDSEGCTNRKNGV